MAVEVTGAEIMGVVGFIIMLIGAISGMWWRVEGKVKVAEDKADLALHRLSEHKIHAAETFVSKAGLREAVSPIMDAIHDVKGAVDNLRGRIDGLYAQSNRNPD